VLAEAGALADPGDAVALVGYRDEAVGDVSCYGG
jgi:hypothetical protein